MVVVQGGCFYTKKNPNNKTSRALVQLCREQTALQPGNPEFVVPVQLSARAAARCSAQPPCSGEP